LRKPRREVSFVLLMSETPESEEIGPDSGGTLAEQRETYWV
jgi:hypothetical protein